jgi:hypothetical protein
VSVHPPTVEVATVGEPKSRPVFLDGSGRRRGALRLVGVLAATGLAATLGLLILGVSGASPLSIPGLPEIHKADVESTTTPIPKATVTTPPTSTKGLVPVGPIVVSRTQTKTTAPKPTPTSPPTTTTPTTPPPTTTTPPPTATQTPSETVPPTSDSPPSSPTP